MVHQPSGDPSFVSEGSALCHAGRPGTSCQAPRSETLAWVFLIVGGLILTGASAVYGKAAPFGPADPVPPNPVSGRSVAMATITTADVLARVELLRADLNLIRVEMGQPKDKRTEIAVTNVAPREAVFQALTLFRKAGHLRFEVTGNVTSEQQITLPRDIRPIHVWKIVNAAYKRVLIVKRKLGIRGQIEEPRQDDSVTPSDLFRAIVQASRQFDVLFMQGVSSDNTLQQVTLATNHMARLLEQFPGAIPFPAIPAFEHGKRPVDVQNLLVKALVNISVIAEGSGIETLKLEISKPDLADNATDTISASDVFDMAIILVSQLAYLHAQLQHTDPPAVGLDPGYKVPAHVYQRTKLLLLQLTELEKHVKKNPGWLTR